MTMDTPITRAEHNEFVRRIEDELKRLGNRVSTLEGSSDKISSLSIQIERLLLKIDVYEKQLSDIKDDVDELKDRDGDMWRKLVSYAVTAIAGLAIGAVWNMVFGG